tara:strand:+ start:8 stop:280 length:273 start_codon:yes stop_codon:yes gene_type:complete
MQSLKKGILGIRMFISRNNKKIVREPCARCMILRWYFSAILVIGIFALFSGDKVQYLKFVNKETAAYGILILGTLVFFYRVLEWFLVYRK